MAEEKKETLVEEVEGVTPEEVQLFKHGTHCDTLEELIEAIKESYQKKSFRGEKGRSQWKRAVKLYEKELYESVFGMSGKVLVKAFAFADYDTIKKNIKELLLNGGKDWEQFSRSGNSLCYDRDIEERLLPPSQRGRYGGERLLAMQAEALEEAARIVACKLAPVVDWAELACWRNAVKVYGAEGHRQRASFGHSSFYDFGKKGLLTRKVSVLKEDINKTNEYAVMICDCDTRRDVCNEAIGQLSDGAFENCECGRCETVFFGKI